MAASSQLARALLQNTGVCISKRGNRAQRKRSPVLYGRSGGAQYDSCVCWVSFEAKREYMRDGRTDVGYKVYTENAPDRVRVLG